MSASELDEHRRYLTDARKIDAYRAALAHYVTPESVVLDLGAGTGLLGLLAAECGAKRVYAVEVGSIIRPAEAMARANGMSARIVHIKGLSTDIDLPEPADIVLCDQIGGFVHDAGVLTCFADAAARLASKGAVFIPGSFDLDVTAVAHEDLEAIVADWTSTKAHGIAANVFADAAANTEHRVNAPAASRLGSSARLCSVQSHVAGYFGGIVELRVERSGRFCGLVGTFVAHLAPGVTLTNSPWTPDRFRRWQNLYPVSRAFQVEPGDVIQASFDVSPLSSMVAWQGSVQRGGSQVFSFRQDTLTGKFNGPDQVLRSSEHWVPTLGDRSGLARLVIDLADGSASVGQIADELIRREQSAFRSRSSALSFIRWVLDPIANVDDL